MVRRVALLIPFLVQFCWPFQSVFCQAKIKIGVSLPLSGEAAIYGIDIKNVLLFADSKLGKNRFEFVFEDDKCSGKEAATIAQKFVNVDRIRYALGYGCSGAFLAAAPIFERAEIVAISSGSSSPAVSSAGDYIFRTAPNDRLLAEALYPYIAARQRRLGVINEETEYALGFFRSFSELNSGKSLVVTAQSFLPSDRDFRSPLLKLKSERVEALLINSQTEVGLAAAFRQYLQMHWELPVYSLYFAGSPFFIEQMGSKADGLIFADTPPLDVLANRNGKNLFSEFVASYGPPKSLELLFLTTYLAFDALQQAVESGQEVRNFLYRHRFNSVVDNAGFDRNGDIEGIAHVLKIFKEGRPVLLPK